MLWTVIGLLLQLFAGLIFALPHISPGITEKIEKSWRTGRGKLWSVFIIWFVIAVIVVLFLGVSNYAKAIYTIDIFLNALVGSIAALAGYLAFVILLGNQLYENVPKWIKDNKKFSESIKYEKILSANKRIYIISLIMIILLTLFFYFFKSIPIVNSFLGDNVVLALTMSLVSFALMNILTLSFYILDKLASAIDSWFRKPLWAYIILIFISGCILQIVGVFINR